MVGKTTLAQDGTGCQQFLSLMLIMLESHQTMQRFVNIIIQAIKNSVMGAFSKGLLIILDAILYFGRYLKTLLQ